MKTRSTAGSGPPSTVRALRTAPARGVVAIDLPKPGRVERRKWPIPVKSDEPRALHSFTPLARFVLAETRVTMMILYTRLVFHIVHRTSMSCSGGTRGQCVVVVSRITRICCTRTPPFAPCGASMDARETRRCPVRRILSRGCSRRRLRHHRGANLEGGARREPVEELNAALLKLFSSWEGMHLRRETGEGWVSRGQRAGSENEENARRSCWESTAGVIRKRVALVRRARVGAGGSGDAPVGELAALLLLVHELARGGHVGVRWASEPAAAGWDGGVGARGRQRAPSGGAMANPRRCDDTRIAADAMCWGPVRAGYPARVPGVEGLLSHGDRGNVRGHGVHVALRHGVGAQRHRGLVLGRFSLHRVCFPSRCGVRESGRVRARNFADDVGTSSVGSFGFVDAVRAVCAATCDEGGGAAARQPRVSVRVTKLVRADLARNPIRFFDAWRAAPPRGSLLLPS